MKSENQNRKTPPPVINVTPLIDVLLVLLIIFMIISPSKANKFDARIPDKPDHNIDTGNDIALVVTIDREGGYALNMQPANTLGELQSLLSRALDGRPSDQKAVFLKGPRTLNYGEVAKVIDVMKGAGCAPIGLQIENLDQ
jgi:biopolymer transport protein ExbD